MLFIGIAVSSVFGKTTLANIIKCRNSKNILLLIWIHIIRIVLIGILELEKV